MTRTFDEFIKRMQEKPLILQRCAESIVLRPNDNISWHGEEVFKNKIKAVEFMLNTKEYINSELRKYYYDMKNNEHNFNNFERWQVWGRQ
jgi:hypothetical protein